MRESYNIECWNCGNTKEFKVGDEVTIVSREKLETILKNKELCLGCGDIEKLKYAGTKVKIVIINDLIHYRVGCANDDDYLRFTANMFEEYYVGYEKEALKNIKPEYPKYVKCLNGNGWGNKFSQNGIYIVSIYNEKEIYLFYEKGKTVQISHSLINDFIPATKEEYDAYVESMKNKTYKFGDVVFTIEKGMASCSHGNISTKEVQDMSTFKKIKVVMLPTNEKAENCIIIGCNSNHLYFLSDEPIKEGDWYVDDTNAIRIAITSDKDYWNVRKDYKKIIASTDDKSNYLLAKILPKPGKEFIDFFISEYNKSNVITDVMVLYQPSTDSEQLIIDERIYKSQISFWKNGYGTGTTQEEINAMEWIAQMIYDKYIKNKLK